MSITVMLIVLRTLTSLTPTEKLVLVAMGAYADDAGGNVWPSQATLAKETSLTDRTVRKTLANLVRRGFLEVVEHAAARRSTRYRIVLDSLLRPECGSDRDAVDRNHVPPYARNDVPVETPQTGTTFLDDRNHVPPRAEPRSYDPSIDPSLRRDREHTPRARSVDRNVVPAAKRDTDNSDDERIKALMAEGSAIGIPLQRFVLEREFIMQASYRNGTDHGMDYVTEFVAWACPHGVAELEAGPLQVDPAKWWRQMWAAYGNQLAMFRPESWHDECARLHGSACCKQLEHSHRMHDEAAAREAVS